MRLLAFVKLTFRRAQNEGRELGGVLRAGLATVGPRDLFFQRGASRGRHLPLEERLVQSVEDEAGLVDVDTANQIRRGDRYIHNLVFGQRQSEIHPRNQRAGIDPFARVLGVPGGGLIREQRFAHLDDFNIQRFAPGRGDPVHAASERGTGLNSQAPVERQKIVAHHLPAGSADGRHGKLEWRLDLRAIRLS